MSTSLFGLGGVPLEARSHARHLGRGHLWAAAHRRSGRLGSSFAPKFGIPRICKVVTGWRQPGWLPAPAAPAATFGRVAARWLAGGSQVAGGWQPVFTPWQPPICPAARVTTLGPATTYGAPVVNHVKCGHYTRRHAWARILANIRAHARCRVY